MSDHFAPSIGTHLSSIMGPVIFGWFATVLASPGSNPVDTSIRFVLAAIFGLLSLAWFGTYLFGGVNRYEITDEGLVIRRPWGRHLIPWDNLRSIDGNRWGFIMLRGTSSTLAYTNPMAFPRFSEFITTLQRRSSCVLTPQVRNLL